jgi:2-aminoadipate transaminase
MTDTTSLLSRAAAQMTESAIRKMGSVLASGRDVISFAPGYPAPDTFAWDEFSQIAADLLASRDGSVLQYGPTRGFRGLLEAIPEILSLRGITSNSDQVIVTTGSQQALDLCGHVFADAEDAVLVELPTYTGAITAFRNVRAHMEGVPQEDDGIDLAALDEIHARLVGAGRRVRLLYVVPNFQNPTGLLIRLEKRRRLLQWAAAHDVLILEDDPYRELYFEDSATEADVRPLKADDDEGRVIYSSSFSKTLAPGFRVAWIDAPAPIAVKLEMAKQAGDLCSGILDQRIVYEAVHRGIVDRRLPLLRQHYAAKRDVMVAALGQELGGEVSWPDPRGGFFLWVTLPERIDADRMLERAVQQGVVYVAGSAFYVNDGGAHHIRLAFSAPGHDVIRDGVARLARTIREERAGAPEPSARASTRY